MKRHHHSAIAAVLMTMVCVAAFAGPASAAAVVSSKKQPQPYTVRHPAVSPPATPTARVGTRSPQQQQRVPTAMPQSPGVRNFVAITSEPAVLGVGAPTDSMRGVRDTPLTLGAANVHVTVVLAEPVGPRAPVLYVHVTDSPSLGSPNATLAAVAAFTCPPVMPPHNPIDRCSMHHQPHHDCALDVYTALGDTAGTSAVWTHEPDTQYVYSAVITPVMIRSSRRAEAVPSVVSLSGGSAEFGVVACVYDPATAALTAGAATVAVTRASADSMPIDARVSVSDVTVVPDAECGGDAVDPETPKAARSMMRKCVQLDVDVDVGAMSDSLELAAATATAAVGDRRRTAASASTPDATQAATLLRDQRYHHHHHNHGQQQQQEEEHEHNDQPPRRACALNIHGHASQPGDRVDTMGGVGHESVGQPIWTGSSAPEIMCGGRPGMPGGLCRQHEIVRTWVSPDLATAVADVQLHFDAVDTAAFAGADARTVAQAIESASEHFTARIVTPVRNGIQATAATRAVTARADDDNDDAAGEGARVHVAVRNSMSPAASRVWHHPASKAADTHNQRRYQRGAPATASGATPAKSVVFADGVEACIEVTADAAPAFGTSPAGQRSPPRVPTDATPATTAAATATATVTNKPTPITKMDARVQSHLNAKAKADAKAKAKAEAALAAKAARSAKTNPPSTASDVPSPAAAPGIRIVNATIRICTDAPVCARPPVVRDMVRNGVADFGYVIGMGLRLTSGPTGASMCFTPTAQTQGVIDIEWEQTSASGAAPQPQTQTATRSTARVPPPPSPYPPPMFDLPSMYPPPPPIHGAVSIDVATWCVPPNIYDYNTQMCYSAAHMHRVGAFVGLMFFTIAAIAIVAICLCGTDPKPKSTS